MTTSSPIWLLDGGTHERVDAVLHRNIDQGSILAAETRWMPYRQELSATLANETEQWRPGHLHWSWSNKLEFTQYSILTFFGIECQGEMQGMMVVATEGHYCRLSEQEAMPLVYVEYLEAAPWNIRALTPEPRFTAVGANLMLAAVEFSFELEYKGRCGLHSLPGSEAGQPEWFYENVCGMTCLGHDLEAGGLAYFEMTTDSAQSFLEIRHGS